MAKVALRYVMALFFISAGVSHFTDTAFFVSICPDYLPFKVALVYLSGIAEIAGGVGLLIERTRKWAAWGLIALLVAVYPANIDMALNPHPWPDAPPWMGLDDPQPVLLYIRLVVQWLLIGAVYVFTRSAPIRRSPTSPPGSPDK